MPATPRQDTQSWIAFSYLSFAVAAGMMGLGIAYLPLEPWMRGYLGMGALMLVQSCVTLTKTLRDRHEAQRDEGVEAVR